MSRLRIACLSIAATVVAALGAGVALAEPPNEVAPWSSSNPGPYIGDPNQRINESAMYAPQLFGFSSLSNKSGSLGDAGCLARSATSRRRPQVIATFPAQGAVVRPGVVVVRVTFDQPMACDASFEGLSDLPNPCPGRWREVTISRDQRSFRTVCEVKANTRYRLTLRSFHNGHGMAVAAEVTFSTSGAAPIATIQQALAEDPAGPEIAGG